MKLLLKLLVTCTLSLVDFKSPTGGVVRKWTIPIQGHVHVRYSAAQRSLHQRSECLCDSPTIAPDTV